MSSGNNNRIDTHIHLIPPSFAPALKAAGGDPSGYPLPTFSTSALFSAIEELGVETAVLSLTAPGPAIAGSGPEGRQLARKCNDEAMQIVEEGKGRFKLFGSTPSWTDVQGTIDEIEYCLRQLGCVGIVCMTSYEDRLLGDPLFKPIWDKLDALGAVVFIHPSSVKIFPDQIASILPQPIVDYPQETNRTAVDLVFTGTIREHPHIKPILSHAGGTLPYLADRVSGLGAKMAEAKAPGLSTSSVENDFRRFWLDVAIGTSRVQLIGLLEFTTPDKILYGSDWPYLPLEHGKRYGQQLDAFLETDEGKSMAGVTRENAIKLFGWSY